jgi:hypothetical protein
MAHPAQMAHSHTLPAHPAPYDGIKEEIQGMAQLRWRIQLSAR